MLYALIKLGLVFQFLLAALKFDVSKLQFGQCKSVCNQWVISA